MGNKVIGLVIGIIIFFIAVSLILMLPGTTLSAQAKEMLTFLLLIIAIGGIPMGLSL